MNRLRPGALVFLGAVGGVVVALTVAFLAEKLCGSVNWPWVWVTAPLWILAAALAVVAVWHVVAVTVDDLVDQRRRRLDAEARRAAKAAQVETVDLPEQDQTSGQPAA